MKKITILTVFLTLLSWQTNAQCADPTALTSVNVTTTSTDLGWTDNASTATWDIEWGTAGFTPTGTPTIIGTTTNPYNLTSLTPNTSYDFYVRADCAANGTSAWIGPFNFTSACVATTLPWSEGFDNIGAIPNCWTMAGGEDWLFNDSGTGEHIGNGGTLSGTTTSNSYFAWADASGTDGPRSLTSPFVDITALTVPQLSFYEISDNEGNANSVLDVEVWDGTTWNTMGTYNTNTIGWEKKEILLSTLTFTGPVAVRFTFSETTTIAAYYDDIAIDDVTLKRLLCVLLQQH